MAKKRVRPSAAAFIQQADPVEQRIDQAAEKFVEDEITLGPAPRPERPPRDDITQISIRVSKEKAARWRSAAREDRQTISSLIVEEVEQGLDRREAERGEPYPESMPEGYKLMRGPRAGG